jgi:prepilin-type N-terminal cleavage/methylation domain-containing protein
MQDNKHPKKISETGCANKKLRNAARSNKGFTLIELLVVMGIISTLVAVALPRYASYRANAFDSRAEMDLRSVAMAEEAYFLENSSYLSCAGDGCSRLPGIKRLSSGVDLSITVSDSGFIGTSLHPKGTGKIFKWDSEQGGFVG